MWSWETVASMFLVLIGLGVTAGQGFKVNGWVLLFWGVAVLLILVRWRHREPDEELQSYEGTLGDGPSIEPASSTYVGQLSALDSCITSELPARLQWHPVQPGLAVDVVSQISEPMLNAQLIVRDMQWWNGELGRFVRTPGMHSGGGFEELALHGTSQKFSGTPSMFIFLQTGVNDSAIRVNGFSPADPTHASVKKRDEHTGRWRVDFRLTWDSGVHDQALEFVWDGRRAPTPLL